MQATHIAFILEQAYGHILPSAGITLELIKRNHRVSYAVTQSFAPAIRRLRAHAQVINPLRTRPEILTAVAEKDEARLDELLRTRSENSLEQLERLYSEDKPDLIIQDECEDQAGSLLAAKWNIPQIRFCPWLIDASDDKVFRNDELVLAAAPRFFVRNIEFLSDRIKLVGFDVEGRKRFFQPWAFSSRGRKMVLISVTTGILPQTEFCKLAIETFRDQPFDVVLSIGGFDRNSAIDLAQLGTVPKNIRLNSTSSNLEILEHACLYIGQGGQGSTMEAIHSGVPVILIPPSRFQDPVSMRMVELGLCVRIDPAGLTPEVLRRHVEDTVRDNELRRRVSLARDSMRAESGAELAADIIEKFVRDKR